MQRCRNSAAKVDKTNIAYLLRNGRHQILGHVQLSAFGSDCPGKMHNSASALYTARADTALPTYELWATSAC
jgi:hypothetical protein